MPKRIAALLVIPLYFASASLVLARADSVVVQDSGEVDLVIEQSVLGVSAATPAPAKSETKSPPPPPVPVRTVNLVPANTPSKVTVQSAKTDEKKVNVTITTRPAAPSPAKTTTAPGQTSTSPPVTTTPPPATIISTQTVDRVILQGADKKPVVSVSSAPNSQVNIQQGPINAATTLPISIDSTTHAITTTTKQGETKLLLPKTVVDQVVKEGLIKGGATNQSVRLSQGANGEVMYSVQQTGKLFGIVAVPPTTITVSNATGKISAPLFTRFLAPFLR